MQVTGSNAVRLCSAGSVAAEASSLDIFDQILETENAADKVVGMPLLGLKKGEEKNI